MMLAILAWLRSAPADRRVPRARWRWPSALSGAVRNPFEDGIGGPGRRPGPSRRTQRRSRPTRCCSRRPEDQGASRLVALTGRDPRTQCEGENHDEPKKNLAEAFIGRESQTELAPPPCRRGESSPKRRLSRPSSPSSGLIDERTCACRRRRVGPLPWPLPPRKPAAAWRLPPGALRRPP